MLYAYLVIYFLIIISFINNTTTYIIIHYNKFNILNTTMQAEMTIYVIVRTKSIA